MIVILPDIHQELSFVQKILKRHAADEVSRIICLGDYFDARSDAGERHGVEGVCEMLNRMVRDYGERLTLLVGNHDLPYLECCWEQMVLSYPLGDNSHYSTLAAERVMKQLAPGTLAHLRLLHTEGRVIFSHAGLNAEFYARWSTDAGYRAKLRRYSKNPRTPWRVRAPELLAVGEARGGRAPLGGLLWQDWKEWTTRMPARANPAGWWQVFGHTIGRPRVHGNAVCLDAEQSAYATWDAAGLTFRQAATGAPLGTVAGFPGVK